MKIVVLQSCRITALALGVAVAVGAVGNATAAGAPRKVTLEFGVGATYVDLPGVSGSAAAISDLNTAGPQFGNQLISRQPRVNGTDLEEAGLTGLLGLDIPLNGGLPLANASLVLEAILASWDDSSVRNDPLAATATSLEAFELLGLNAAPLAAGQGNPFTFGSVSNAANVIGNVGVIAVPGQTVTTVARRDADYVEGRFMFAGDGASNGNMTPRWSFGLVVADLNQDYNIRQDARLSGFRDISQTLDEELDSFIIGPQVGVDLQFAQGSNTTWHVLGDLAALYFDTDLTARQNADWTGIGRVFGPPTPTPVILAQNDDESAFSGRVNLGLGVEHDFGPMSLGVEGSVTYWSYIPMVDNPKARVGDETGVATSRPARVRIDDDDMTTGQVLLTAKFPIN
jgi:hypothetical protein